jgi:pimeloyl-ACP methyl ester carboxylesterase
MVDALVAVNGVPHGYEWPDEPYIPPQWEESVAAFKSGNLERASELEVQIWIDGPSRTADEVDPAIRDKVRAMNLIALTNEFSAERTITHLEPPAAQRLDELHLPVLFVAGDLDDPDSVRAVQELARQIEGAELVTIEGTAHLPNMEKPEPFNREIRAFFAR